MANELQLFSKNESLDDLSSSSMRYLTLPAFLGFFTSQKSGEDRLSNLQMAEVGFFASILYSVNVCRPFIRNL